MSSYILVRAVDGWDPGNEMVYQTGYLVDVKNVFRLGGKQVPPNFIQIEITDDDDFMSIQEAYCRTWMRDIDWEFVGHDYTIDGHRLRVFTKPDLVSASGINSLTRNQVENFLTNWGAIVVSVAQNEVVFDAIVYDAITSEGFWAYDVDLVDFSEISYDQGTGVHRVEADYANDPRLSAISKQKIEDFIEGEGGAIVGHPAQKVRFDIERSTVFANFKLEVKKRLNKTFSRRRFKMPQQYVQMALDNGGTLSVTKQQLINYIYNRLDD